MILKVKVFLFQVFTINYSVNVYCQPSLSRASIVFHTAQIDNVGMFVEDLASQLRKKYFLWETLFNNHLNQELYLYNVDLRFLSKQHLSSKDFMNQQYPNGNARFLWKPIGRKLVQILCNPECFPSNFLFISQEVILPIIGVNSNSMPNNLSSVRCSQ